MELREEDVFRPGAFTEYTYISRKSGVSNLPYEFWKLVVAKAGLAYEGQFSTEHIIMDT